MQTFKQFLTERFINAVGNDDTAVEIKNKYKQQVWDLLQSSYKNIGGIKGSGFKSAKDMVENIPFWKIVVKDEKVHAVVLYKDKGGRKSVAVASDGSEYANKQLTSIFAADPERSYGEKSKSALGKVMKTLPWVVLEPMMHTPTESAKILKTSVQALTDVPKEDWPADAVTTIEKFPELLKYGYLREIGKDTVFKVLIGTPGKNIG